MISSQASLRDILPNEAPPKGNVYEMVQKIENWGTLNGGDAITQIKRRSTNGKELGSKVSSTVVSPTKKITKINIKNSHAKMKVQSDRELAKARISDFPLIVEPKEVQIFENNFLRSPIRLSDYESSHIDHTCPDRIEYGSKEVITKNEKAIDIQRNHCCAVQKLHIQCVSTLEKYCSSMKKCFKKVVKKAKLKNKEYHRPYFKKRKSLNQIGCDRPVMSGQHTSQIEVRNLKVQRNSHICTPLDDGNEACSTEEESRIHYIPNCRPDCQRRHKRISCENLSCTPVYVLSSDESSANETPSMEDTSSRAVHALSPIFESANVVCGHRSTSAFKKSMKKSRDSSGLYLIRIPKRSDSKSVICANNERNIYSGKVRQTKNYVKQFKSNSSSFIMAGSWAKKIKKEGKIEEDRDINCEDEDAVINKPIRITSKCLICKDCVKNNENNISGIKQCYRHYSEI